MTWENTNEFGPGGRELHTKLHRPDDDGPTTALVVEACRMKDRLDRLHRLIRGDEEAWTRVLTVEGELVLKLDSAVSEARQLATVFRQTLVEIQRRQGDVGADDEDGLADL